MPDEPTKPIPDEPLDPGADPSPVPPDRPTA